MVEHQLRPEDDSRIGQAIDEQLLIHWDSSSAVEHLLVADYPTAYNYLDSLLLLCLAEPQFEQVQAFNWRLRIFRSAEKEQLFVAPGGYLYFSTDFLHFLANEQELKAVMAHAILSIDQRIITQQLQAAFSISYLLDLALGAQPEALPQLLEVVQTASYTKAEMEQLEPLFEDLLCQLHSSPDQMLNFLQRIQRESNFEWALRFNNDFDWQGALRANNNCPLGATLSPTDNYQDFLDQLP